MTSDITITKIEAAHRQLKMAIALWFADADPISIHTLAAAAYQIIHDLNKKNKGPGLLLDTKFIKDEYRREFINEVKNASNFLKHADKGKMGLAMTFEFNPKSNEHFITFAIIGLKYLGEKLTAEEIAFERWSVFQKPHLMTEAGIAMFQHTFTDEQLDKIRGMPKHEFFEAFRQLVRQSVDAQTV